MPDAVLDTGDSAVNNRGKVVALVEPLFQVENRQVGVGC